MGQQAAALSKPPYPDALCRQIGLQLGSILTRYNKKLCFPENIRHKQEPKIPVKNKNASPTWSEVKTRLAGFDRAGLLGLVKDLYALGKDNQAFLHARLSLGADPLTPYKATISRWICPDVFKNQPISIAKAKKAISDYKKAVGGAEGMAELCVFYCEQVFVFFGYCGVDDEDYFSALVRMFDQALKWIMSLPEDQRQPLVERLERILIAGHSIGWGVGYDFDRLWADANLEFPP